MIQHSVAVRNAEADSIETTISTSPRLLLFSGAVPANCAAADPAGLLATITLPSDWLNAASGGSKTLLGSWSGTASAAGTVASYRIKDSGLTTCHEQGHVYQNVIIATNALTAANGNVLNFASTTGVVVGMNISGTGVPTGATVVATTGTTVTMSMTSTAGVANGASITFGGDLALDNVVVANGQAISVSTWTRTIGNA